MIVSLNSRGRKTNRQNRSLALIVTALTVEREAVLSQMLGVKRDVDTLGTTYWTGEIGEWSIALAEIGQTNPTAGTMVERAVQRYSPSVAALVGVAGGLKDVSIGDVVVADLVFGYERGKVTNTEAEARTEAAQPSYRGVQIAKAMATLRPSAQRPLVHVGPIVTGEKVVAGRDSTLAKDIRRRFGNALAIEMEALGFVRTLHAYPNIQSIVIRGISDLLDNKSEADESGAQEHAARSATTVAVSILSELSASNASSFAGTSTPEPQGSKAAGTLAPEPQSSNAAGTSTPKPPQSVEAIWKAVRRRRRAMGLTQRELAEELGLSTEFISRLERGVTGPSVDTLLKFAAVFKCTVDDLLH